MLTITEIEAMAAKNRAMPKFTELPEMYLYQTLAALYIRYYAKQITQEAAHTEKIRIIKAYKDLRAEYDKYRQVYIDREAIIRRTYDSISNSG